MKVIIITAMLPWLLVLSVAACGTSETQINWNDPIADGATLTYADARDMVIEAGPFEIVDHKDYASDEVLYHLEVARRWNEMCLSDLPTLQLDPSIRCTAVWAGVANHLFPEIGTASAGTVECPEEKLDVKTISEAKDERVGVSNSDLTVGDAIQLAKEAGEFNSLEGDPMTLEWRDKYEQFWTAQEKWFDMCYAAYRPDFSRAHFQCTTIWLGAYWYEYPEQYDKYHALHCAGSNGPKSRQNAEIGFYRLTAATVGTTSILTILPRLATLQLVVLQPLYRQSR